MEYSVSGVSLVSWTSVTSSPTRTYRAEPRLKLGMQAEVKGQDSAEVLTSEDTCRDRGRVLKEYVL